MAFNSYQKNGIVTQPHPPKSPKPRSCDDERKYLMVHRNYGAAQTDNKYDRFIRDIGVKIINKCIGLGFTTYATVFIVSQAANESGYGTTDAAMLRHNYFGVDKGKTPYPSFESCWDAYHTYLSSRWPDFIALCTSKVKISATDYLEYYFTFEEVDQAFNSGKYGSKKNPAVLKSKLNGIDLYAYNVDFYVDGVKNAYAAKIFGAMKLVLNFIDAVNTENITLSSYIVNGASCETRNTTIQNISARCSNILANLSYIKNKNYGYFMPVTSQQTSNPIYPAIDMNNQSCTRPNMIYDPSNPPKPLIDARIIHPNSVNVTWPVPID